MSDVRVRSAGPAPPEMHEPTATDRMAAHTPSQIIVRGANEVTRFQDSKGRTIGIKRLSTIERARMFRMLGPEDSRNEAYMSFAFPCFCVVEIDGEILPPMTAPSRQATIQTALEGLMARLGDEGLQAVNEAIIEHWGADAEV